MKGYLFFALLALSCAFNVSAQTNFVLPEPHPSQTGFYQITNDVGELLPATGAAIQVFARGERILQDGTVLLLPFVFGAVYESDTTWFTFQGAVHPVTHFNEVDVVVAVVTSQDENGQPVVEILTAGQLQFDPSFDGNAYSFILRFTLEDELFTYHFVSQSDKTVVGCRIVGFSPPDPTLYACPAAQ